MTFSPGRWKWKAFLRIWTMNNLTHLSLFSGNAVVPQQFCPIFRAIAEMERRMV